MFCYFYDFIQTFGHCFGSVNDILIKNKSAIWYCLKHKSENKLKSICVYIYILWYILLLISRVLDTEFCRAILLFKQLWAKTPYLRYTVFHVFTIIRRKMNFAWKKLFWRISSTYIDHYLCFFFQVEIWFKS